MEYQALYRKYRPKTFNGIIGQEHITTVLKNQIKTGHISHAYLFSGTRGTGKTTTAKVLSRAVNCLSPIDGEPCNECEACKIAADANVDVIELDAASNNGVDDMRALIEKAIFTPVRMKKKVYIIDEAHMLSAAAFNALLKTLEEPPSHVLFILATTEPHKIIPTITSRCQRFDFRRLRTSDITKCLQEVLSQANATISPEGLTTIARKANGGMRDALSLADQCISFCGNSVTADDVYHILGSADFDAVYSIAELLISSNAAEALTKLDELSAGRDLTVLMQDITSHFRSLMLTKVCGNCSDIIDCSEEDMNKLKAQANSSTEQRIMRALDILSKAESEMKYYSQPRLLIETSFVKICRPEYETDMQAALDRIDILEKKLKDGIKPTIITEASTDKKINASKDKPVKKRRVVSEDAMKIFRELCDAMPNMLENIGSYVSTVLLNAVYAEIAESELRLHFTSYVLFNTASDYAEQINTVLSELGYDLKFKPVLDDASDEDSVEKSLIEQFGDVEVFD